MTREFRCLIIQAGLPARFDNGWPSRFPSGMINRPYEPYGGGTAQAFHLFPILMSHDISGNIMNTTCIICTY